MKWVDKMPEEFGWYWVSWNQSGRSQVIRLTKSHLGGGYFSAMFCDGLCLDPEGMDCKWLGPITPEQAEKYE